MTAASAKTRRTELLDIMIVDDDPLARRAIRESLSREADLDICAEAGSGPEAIELARRTCPDVIVMDVTMPGLDGIAATRRILEARPDTKVVVFSATTDDELALLALRAGASGYLTKGIDLAVLPRVVRGVAAGEAAITRRLSAKLLERFRLLAEGADGMRPVRSPLTPREWEVLDLLCAEMTTEGIAEELSLSIETVRSHVKHILRKLGVHSRAEAVRFADEVRRPRFPVTPSTNDRGGPGADRT